MNIPDASKPNSDRTRRASPSALTIDTRLIEYGTSSYRPVSLNRINRVVAVATRPAGPGTSAPAYQNKTGAVVEQLSLHTTTITKPKAHEHERSTDVIEQIHPKTHRRHHTRIQGIAMCHSRSSIMLSLQATPQLPGRDRTRAL